MSWENIRFRWLHLLISVKSQASEFRISGMLLLMSSASTTKKTGSGIQRCTSLAPFFHGAWNGSFILNAGWGLATGTEAEPLTDYLP